MKKLWDYISEHRIRFSFVLGLVVLFGLLIGLRYIPEVSEFWTTTIGRAYQTVVGFISSLFPWSFFELGIIVAIIFVVDWLVHFILKTKKEGFKKSSVKIVDLFLVVMTVLTIYVSTAGMAYHRKPLDLKLKTDGVEQAQYYDISMWAINELNKCSAQLEYEENGSVKRPYSNSDLYDKIEEEYSRIDDDYLTKFTAKPKKLTFFGWLYTEMHISGVSFLPTGESNYNQNIPNIDIPFVVAHELAHTKGVMSETEANDFAMYVCMNSSDPYLRYSALCNAFEGIETMAMTANDDEKMNTFYTTVSENVWKDFLYTNEYWNKHTFFKDIAKWFNDLYLKIFGSQTTEAYIDHIDDDVVIIDDKPTFVLHSLSPYQEILVDLWLKENGH